MERRETDGSDAAGTAQFVEDLGLYFEAYGLTRMAGRMLGHLLVSAPGHQSADQLMNALRWSSLVARPDPAAHPLRSTDGRLPGDPGRLSSPARRY